MDLYSLHFSIIFFAFIFIPVTKEDSVKQLLKKDQHLNKFIERFDASDGRTDIVFLMDESGSLTRHSNHFDNQKVFVELIARFFNIRPDHTRLTLITYGNYAKVRADYINNSEGDICNFLYTLKSIKFKGGFTNPEHALITAGKVLSGSDAKRKYIVMLSDGCKNLGKDPLPTAKDLQKQGIVIFGIAVGKTCHKQLKSLLTSSSLMFTVKNLDTAKNLIAELKMSKSNQHWVEKSSDHCNGLCKKSGKCCDSNAQCGCDSGGDYKCVCLPGSTGSGYPGQCLKCARGTYSVMGRTKCQHCPLNSNTSFEGAASIKACICNHGFSGFPQRNEPCEFRKCPKLRPPVGGVLVPPFCGRNVNDTCSFWCKYPYCPYDGSEINCLKENSRQLQDPRVCMETREWSGPEMTCEMARCSQPPMTENIRYKCNSKNHKIGSKCFIKCNEGFSPVVTNAYIECASNGTWVGFSSCARSKCSPLKIDFKVNTQPNECSKVSQAVGTKCTLFCTNGYKLRNKINTNVVTCDESGNWNHDMSSVSCQDEFGPAITCPPPISIFNDPLKKTTLVDWTSPTFLDNDDYPPIVTSMNSSITSPHFFEIGEHKLIYKATDVNGLSSTCEFVVTVLDVDPPLAKFCPEDQEVYSTDTSVEVVWKEPEFWDNSGDYFIQFQTYKSGDRFEADKSYQVNYEASDASGNTITCQFNINIKPYKCPYHPPPSNGAVNCTDYKNGAVCIASCNAGHDFIFQSDVTYYCENNYGNYEWRQNEQPVNPQWPNCAEKTPPESGTLNGKLLFYSDSCTQLTEEELAAIGTEIEEKLRFESPACENGQKCDFEIDSSFCIPKGIDSVRRKRDANGNFVFSFEFHLKFGASNFTEKITEKEVFPMTSNILSSFYKVVDTKDSGTLYSSINLECSMKQLTDNDECLSCPVGTYYETGSENCKFCLKNTYQDTESASECKPCPYLTYTLGEGTESKDECKPHCETGEYSKTGFAPCTACPIGTYQDETGQVTCKNCSESKNTWSVGSYAEHQCTTACPIGQFSPTGFDPCIPCPRGFYQNLKQSTGCVKCDNSLTTITVGSDDVSQCLEINPCQPNPCLNNAICSHDAGKVSCVCASGYFGSRCDIEIDHCDVDRSCLNGGICINNHQGYSCNCLPGYSGFYCEEKTKNCVEDNCLNGGTCIDDGNSYHCQCLDGFTGANCEQNFDDCVPGICQNGGTCYDSGKPTADQKFYCCCPKGYHGSLCDKQTDCESIHCANGGTCIANNCVCKSGFTGNLCENKIDYCSPQPCKNSGTCISNENSFTCYCSPGFRGRLCDYTVSFDFDVDFLTRDTNMYSLVKTNKNLNALTLSFWMKIDPDEKHLGTPISYSYESPIDGHSETNGLTFHKVNEFAIYLHGKELQTSTSGSSDKTWHHNVFIWDSFDGFWAFYRDGEQVANGTGIGIGTPLWKGFMVIGQDQNTVGGGFKQIDSFKGSLSQINLWDFTMTADEIAHLHRSCGHIGNVIGWPDFEISLSRGFVAAKPSKICSTLNVCGQIQECHCHRHNVFNSTLCENRLESCNPNPCKNGQQCTSVNNISFCDCNVGYAGKFCQYDINECIDGTDGCSHHCINKRGSYSCICPKGYVLDKNLRTCKLLRQCSYKGLLYADKEEWNDGCETCSCVKGDVNCYRKKCEEIECLPPFIAVRNPKDCCSSCVQHPAVCTINRNSFMTFDNFVFAHTIHCHDILAQDCSQNRFSVQLRVIKSSSVQNILVFRSDCTTIELTFEGNLVVNGEPQNISFENESQNFRVDFLKKIKTKNSPKFVITTEDGVAISWYHNEEIKISVPKTMYRQMCGLCGDFNGDATDDTRTRSYEIADTLMEFVRSWKVETTQCSAPIYKHPGVPSINRIGECPNGWKFAVERCEPLRTPSFYNCYDVLNPQESYDYCLQDACKCTGDLCYCDAIHKYIAECMKLNVDVDEWQGQEECAKRCTHGTIFSDCGPACPKTCEKNEDDDPRCSIDTCRAGCHCPADTVLHEDYCILPEKCP